METAVRKPNETRYTYIRYIEVVVRNVHEMHRLAAAGPTFLATITLLTVVYTPQPDFKPLFMNFVAKAPRLALVRFGRYIFSSGLCIFDPAPGGDDQNIDRAMRLFFGQIVCQPRHARLYIDLLPDQNLRYFGRALGYFTPHDVCVHGLLSDRSVVDFVQDRHTKILLEEAVLMLRYRASIPWELVSIVVRAYSET
jgi:hypothetical protein